MKREPQPGDTFNPGMGAPKLTIVEVGDVIVDDEEEGRSITCDDGVGYDCFWSEKHQRFQYFSDSYEAKYGE